MPPLLFKKLLQQPTEAMSDLFDTVKKASQSTRATMAVSDVGTVRQVGDGVASLWGLPQARVDDLLQFRTGVMGLVMNLETRWIDCILLGSDEGIQGGDMVRSTGQRITVPVGERLLGRVVDPLGRPVDDRGRLFVDEQRFVEREAPGVVERAAVDTPLHTGIKAVDAIIPIGRGQRELIIGDRQTGKTSLALDAIINQRDTDVLCVYVSIGQRKSSTLQVLQLLREAGALDHTVVVMASPDDPPALVYLAPYTGCTIAEAFMDRGRDVLIIYDDLTKHADAYRELSLLLRRPPGREAYPGDIFYLHSRLLERAGHVRNELGGGSITALPIVETRRGNIQAYIPTNLISITDGQIYLSPDLFNQGIKPAIDVGLSVSRVGGAAQTSVMRKESGRFKLALAQYEEVAHFARFGTEIDQATRQQIVRGERLREALKQPAYSPLSLAQQVLILYAADRGALDGLPLDRIAEYEARLWQYAQREHRSVVRRIEQHWDLDDDLAQDLDQLIAKFSAEFN
ncbi:MAG: F0F1 ATP synthase subunit alpha [Chloroflexi bacterium]|nr:F0F1 ATP synthase subunit alpha [Chloroflexota bacterium]